MRGRGFGFNNANKSTNFRGGSGDGRHEPYRQNEADGSNNIPSNLSAFERKKLQQKTILENFRSSNLTYDGSDQIVFIIDGERIKTVWKKKLEETPWYQNDVRIFVSSALVAADSQQAGELVSKLGNSESGLKKLKEIINFPMSCDAGLGERVLSFQYVILPLLGLLTRTAITKCAMVKHVDAIFMIIYQNLDSFLYKNMMKMLGTLVQRNSIEDSRIKADALLSHEPYAFIPSSLGIFFLIIVRFLTELLRRVTEAHSNETIRIIALNLRELKTKYQQLIEQQWSSLTSTDPLNNPEIRKYFFTTLENEIDIMIKMFNIEHDTSETYGVPGESSKDDEKRHDNDFERISEISIIPTKEEILCVHPPYLPSLSDAHPSLPNGAARLLDRQFRLLREDMLKPIRGGISEFLALLSRNYYFSLNNNNTMSNELENVLSKGKFTCNNNANDINDNGDLYVYADVKFVNIGCDRRNGLFCTLKLRKKYLRNGKRLLTGNLVAILLPNPNLKQSQSDINGIVPMNDSDLYSIYFGVIMPKDEKNEVPEDGCTRIHINFNDPSIYPIALNKVSKFRNSTISTKEKIYMVESTNIYFEAYRHVLKILQTTSPFSLPFKQYLAPEFDHVANTCTNVKIQPPKYTRAPGFRFDLSVLCKDQQNLVLNVANTNTYDETAMKINEYSKLDKSQAQALISALTREIALIEGPPGTGKTVVGVEIMKVLLAEKNRANIGPILTICFTNHALDQFLLHLLDQNITENIVRLGTRTKSERIRDYTIGKVSVYNSGIPSILQTMGNIENKVEELKSSFKTHITWNDISLYLRDNYREFFNKFSNVTSIDLPSWLFGDYDGEETDEDPETNKDSQDSSAEETDDDDSDEERERPHNKYQIVRRKKLSNFENWSRGEDFKRISEINKLWSNDEELDSDDDELFDEFDKVQYVRSYEEPKTDRPLNELLNNYLIWEMSKEERLKLRNYWHAKLDEENLLSLQEEHEDCRQNMNDIYDDARRQILLSKDVIGMTTSGAAKFQNLIKYVDPKIIICEEAGEVLEAHILSALTPSTQHLILIGDHNQLRPHVASYSLSIESYIGENYQLDKSLFERFVDGSNTFTIEKTRLLTQRRMREEISDLIRYTIYEDLEDGENTIDYPDIRGAQHNVYFIDHKNPESKSNNDSAMQSHVNMYEVKMVVEMVKYFVKYGYTKPEDIAVLTPYLGQMSKIREALSESFAVDIDERDAQDMGEMDEEKIQTSKPLNQRVTLRTVDNFQGEEANIVIVSLVRNYSGNNKYSSIGFLRSKNRSNVLLSRAREGMYLIGNAKLMASKSKEMWATVVEILRKRDQVGPGMPIVCKHHPDSKTIITKPEQFDEFCSPNGGCRSICDMPLPCGHTCTDECHFNNLDHKGFICRQPCNKLHSECGHQCPKLCYKDCDICNVALGNIILPCGHIFKNAKCWQNENKEEIKCITTIDIVLPDCEHPLQNVECWRVQNNEKFICQFPINITLPDCGHPLQNVECWRVQNNEKFTCHFPVDIPLPCGHILPNVQCWKRKFKETLECYKIIDVTLPDCGHLIRNIECWSAKDREKSTCDEPVDTILPCGHMQNVKCWKNKNKEKIKCNTIIDIVLPKCGHPYKNVECWRVQNKEKFICKFEMDITLSDCGHPYPNVECWRVQSKELFSCRVKINMILPCGHILRDECGKKHVKETLKCNTLIDKTLSCGHMSKGVECWRVQNEEELICRSLVDITLPCGHTLRNAECWQNKTKETIRCDTIFDTVSPDCGHPLQNVECWRVQNKEEFTCDFLVDIEYSDCEHSFRVKCRKKDKIKKIPKCHHLVDFELPCGHISKYVECWTAKENEPIKCNKSIDFKLPCGHLLKNIKCWESQIEYRPKCNVISDITFPCGHTAENVECWEKGIIKCMEQITIKMPHCEHTGDVRCSESANDIKCKKNCGKQLKCGHQCLKECFRCQEQSRLPNHKYKNKKIERTKHGKCRTRCKKLLYCGHICGQFCHKGECQPCNNECALSCEHKKACNKDCLEPCAVCAKKCSWECRHQEKCELSCGIPCNRLPCNKRCDKKTKCGHACAGICGEICPLYCADVNCAPKKIRNQVSDIINNITFSNINWNKERMIALPCGHIYTMKSMDTLMEMGNYYDGSIDGGWTSVRLFPNSTSIKTCPACQAPVKDIRRYGRIIKKHILDMQNRKFVSKYDDELKKIDKRIVNSSNEMTKKRSNLKDELCDISEFKPRKEFKDKNRGLPEIAPYNYFELIAQYHGFDENSQQVWLSHVSKLLRCYDKLISIIRVAKSSPHKKAFEASSNVRGGSKGDLPFISELDQRIHLIYLDGVLKIINIQKLLYDEILFVIQELSSITKDVTNIKDLWKGFAERLQKSIQTHLCLIKNVAESTDYGKYSLLAKVEILEFDFTMLRNSPNDYASIMRKRDDIERTITNITNSSNFINVEGEFKKGIQDRLIRLWRSCDDIL